MRVFLKLLAPMFLHKPHFEKGFSAVAEVFRTGMDTTSV